MSPFDFGWSWIAGDLDWPTLLSTLTSNGQGQNRQIQYFFGNAPED
jgi:hypothetical protein